MSWLFVSRSGHQIKQALRTNVPKCVLFFRSTQKTKKTIFCYSLSSDYKAQAPCKNQSHCESSCVVVVHDELIPKTTHEMVAPKKLTFN